MKFQVGDLILLKECKYKSGYHLRLRPHLYPHRLYLLYRFRPDLEPHLKNTYGVITQAINHRDAFEGQSTEDHNVYFWYSQVSAKTYWFCQSDLTEYEVVK